ncbi:hypothetical protein PULV_a6009 [Pseudoalteromonas ulvae UL12]|nr:hypothetical protein [Pseudoalteromonas ulvae UL12]
MNRSHVTQYRFQPCLGGFISPVHGCENQWLAALFEIIEHLLAKKTLLC